MKHVTSEVLLLQAAHHRELAELYDRLAALENNQPHSANVAPVQSARRETRLRQVMDCISVHGPKTRREIMMELSLPKGTTDMVLSKKKVFQREATGKYSVIPKA